MPTITSYWIAAKTEDLNAAMFFIEELSGTVRKLLYWSKFYQCTFCLKEFTELKWVRMNSTCTNSGYSILVLAIWSNRFTLWIRRDSRRKRTVIMGLHWWFLNLCFKRICIKKQLYLIVEAAQQPSQLYESIVSNTWGGREYVAHLSSPASE